MKTNSSRRRCRHEIAAQILEVAKDGRNKTYIMYKASLSFSQLNDYLALLLKNELLENMPVKKNNKLKTIYKSTDKGMTYLEGYRAISSLLMI